MAKQVDPATMQGAASPGSADRSGAVEATRNVAQLGPHPAFHGRRVSWIAVSVIMAGFLIGGVALIFGSHGPTWWLFWLGVGVAVLGVLTTLATNTFEDWY